MKSLLAFWGRRNTFSKILIGFGLLCVFNWTRLGLIHAGILPEPTVSASASAPATASEPAPKEVKITMNEYNKLKTGMPYNQVMAILGSDGTELSSNDIGGYHTVMYQWKAGAMANMNATFQNDKLVSKAQFGLE